MQKGPTGIFNGRGSEADVDPVIPTVTPEEAARGWAELELAFEDGSSEFVRVHSLSPTDIVNLLHTDPVQGFFNLIKTALRSDEASISRLSEVQAVAVVAMVAGLLRPDLGDPETLAKCRTLLERVI